MTKQQQDQDHYTLASFNLSFLFYKSQSERFLLLKKKKKTQTLMSSSERKHYNVRGAKSVLIARQAPSDSHVRGDKREKSFGLFV